MNLRTLALAGAAALAFSSPALAQPTGWYLGLGFGYDHLDNQGFKSTGVPTVYDYRFNGGFLGTASAGYKFDFGLRLEGEISYTDHGATWIDVPGTPKFEKSKNSGSSNSSFLINAVYDVDVGGGLGLEVGGGLGVADINEYLHNSGGSFKVASGARTAFEWQIIAGVTAQIADNVVLYTDYRYRRAQVHQTFFNGTYGPNTQTLGTNDESVALIGVRWYLESEAPPPPPPPLPPPPPPPPPVVKTFVVFFDFDKSNLTAEAETVVSEAVKTAKSNGFVKVMVTGHTDTMGSDTYNQALSVRRAQSVKDEMVRQGMDGGSISIEGKSFHDPLVPTGPGVREPQNRRAVIDLG